MQCIQIKDYGDLSYLLEAEYERQLVALSQDAELRSPPLGTRGLTKGKVSPFLGTGGRETGGGGGLHGTCLASFYCINCTAAASLILCLSLTAWTISKLLCL